MAEGDQPDIFAKSTVLVCTARRVLEILALQAESKLAADQKP